MTNIKPFAIKPRTCTALTPVHDSCYFCRTLRERRLPRFAYDKEQMLVSLDRLTALEKGGARIFFGHDPEFWAGVPQAPHAIT